MKLLVPALPALLALWGPSARPQVLTVEPPDAMELGPLQMEQAALTVIVAEGYHVQANPASADFLAPTELRVEGNEAVRVGKIIYPAAKPLRWKGGSDLSVYDGRFVISIALSAPASARKSEHVLRGSLRYQACTATACLAPASVPVALSVHIVTARGRTDWDDTMEGGGGRLPTLPKRRLNRGSKASRAAGHTPARVPGGAGWPANGGDVQAGSGSGAADRARGGRPAASHR